MFGIKRKTDIDRLCEAMKELNKSSEELVKQAKIAQINAESLAEQARLINQAYDIPVRPHFMNNAEVR